VPISNEVRRLNSKWQTNTGWPLRLDWIEIRGIRGWSGQRFALQFPIMAVTGENGVGKSTVLQCAAAVYRPPGPRETKGRFASDFFPDTAWDRVRNAAIGYAAREGTRPVVSAIRKPTDRWRGNPDRPQRHVEYIDLSRIQPVPARLGYTRLANPTFREVDATAFEKSRLERFSEIMGRTYDLAKMALTNADARRLVPVISLHGAEYSGFHQGAGETTIAELLQADLPQYSLVLIDEVESSLHPRAQRRLIRDLAARCRERELQVILTTHSPYVLEELPLEARAYILQPHEGGREIVYGVSPDFAMTKMDDVQHAECDLYVEDHRAGAMLVEILVAANPDLVPRCRTIPYGASSVGQSLGQMVAGNRFPRPSCIFLDGDEGTAVGCLNLPGDDAPERVVFEALQSRSWAEVNTRVGRSYAQVADSCTRAMALTDHHDWVRFAASALTLGGDTLWQAMCAEWAKTCFPGDDAKAIAQAVEDVLIGVKPYEAVATATAALAPPPEPPFTPPIPPSPSEQPPLFEQSASGALV
jgi:predicted ATPase